MNRLKLGRVGALVLLTSSLSPHIASAQDRVRAAYAPALLGNELALVEVRPWKHAAYLQVVAYLNEDDGVLGSQARGFLVGAARDLTATSDRGPGAAIRVGAVQDRTGRHRPAIGVELAQRLPVGERLGARVGAHALWARGRRFFTDIYVAVQLRY